jgi:hypothetical protein
LIFNRAQSEGSLGRLRQLALAAIRHHLGLVEVAIVLALDRQIDAAELEADEVDGIAGELRRPRDKASPIGGIVCRDAFWLVERDGPFTRLTILRDGTLEVGDARTGPLLRPKLRVLGS